MGDFSVRRLALGVLIGASLMVGAAAAEPWLDPAGRLTVNLPAGWVVEPQPVQGEQTVVLAFNASNDCYFFGVPNPATAGSTAHAARNATAQIAPEAWTSVASGVRDFFPDGTAQLVSQSVDTSGFWPVQRAELRGPNKTVFGALSARPGFELRAFCAATSGGSAAAYDAIFASLGHPNDAAWRGEAEQTAAEREAAAAAAAAAQAAQQAEEAAEQERRNRRNR